MTTGISNTEPNAINTFTQQVEKVGWLEKFKNFMLWLAQW